MSKLNERTLLALCMALVAGLGCRGEDPLGADLPDVSGTWLLSLDALPVGTDGDDGSCSLSQLTLVLTRGGAEMGGYAVAGSHGPGELTCLGFTDLARESTGWSDTTIYLSNDAVGGVVSWLCTDPPSLFPTGFGCSSSEPWIQLEIADQVLRGDVLPDRMSGSLDWVRDGAIRLYGTWSGVVSP